MTFFDGFIAKRDVVIVVHGHANYGYTVSDDLARRLDEAAKIFGNTNQASKIVTTGGLMVASQAGVKNSTAAKKYLIDNCYMKADDIIEVESKTTIDEVVKLSKLFDKDYYRIWAVTSKYHAKRVSLIWRLILKRSVKVITVDSLKKSVKQTFIEFIGKIVAYAFNFGFTWPEMKFRQLSRTIND